MSVRKKPSRSENLLERQAVTRASEYELRLNQDGDQFTARVTELPGVIVHGRSAEECFAKAREAMIVTISAMLNRGIQPPVTAAEKKKERRCQINIRLTSKELNSVKAAAVRSGSGNVSEYVRSVILLHASVSDQ